MRLADRVELRWLLILVLAGAGLGLLLRLRLRVRLMALIDDIDRRWQIRTELRQACLAGDAPATRDALLAWGRQRWPRQRIIGLFQISTLLDDPVITALLRELDATLYSTQPDAWRGRPLWCRLKQATVPRQPRRRAGLLHLYPG